jgi:putative transposase
MLGIGYYVYPDFRRLVISGGYIGPVSTEGHWLVYGAESFFHTLKVELIHGKTYNTLQEAKTAILEYIEVFYNWQRRHSYLGYLSPVDFEKKNVA